MKKKDLIIYLVVATLTIALVSVGYSVYLKNIRNNVTQTSSNNIPFVYKNHLEAITKEMFEKEYGIPVKVEVVQKLPDNLNGAKWAMTISLNSLNLDVVLMEDKGQTPWMDHELIDSELTKFEKTEKENFPDATARWKITINNDILSQKMIEQIKTVLIPQWEADLKYLRGEKKKTDDLDVLFTKRFGGEAENITQKYRPFYQSNKDVGFIVSDLIYLLETNLKIKEKTISAIQNKDVNAAVVAANDEDRISLIRSWYDNRFSILLQDYQEAYEAFKELVDKGE